MKIAAVVVTYNRENLLIGCLESLLSQTRPLDEIIVIDNASTDNTSQVVKNRFADVTYVRLAENLGGSGGFHKGMELACQEGYDWVWCMDDDGLPAQDALEKLLAHVSEDTVVINSLVVSEQNPDKIMRMPLFNGKGFPVFWSRKRCISSLAELRKHAGDGKTVRGAKLFNGSLISTQAIDLVGNVRSEMFIRGDEVDMMWRLMNVGSVITVLNAIHYHPELTDEMPLWKRYYALRNRIYINNQYLNFSFFRNVNLIFRVHFLKFLQSWLGIKLFIRAVLEGYSGNLRNHVRPPVK